MSSNTENKESSTIEDLNNLTFSKWHDLTSQSAEINSQSKLEIRTRDITSPSPFTLSRPHITSSKSLPITATQPLISSNASFLTGINDFTPTASKKRHYSEIIDLTIDDEDLDFSRADERKKSRSLSHSTVISTESSTEKRGVVEKTLSRSVNSLADVDTKEKGSLSSSFNPQSSFQRSNPAVIVPPPQLSPQERRRLFLKNLSVLNDVSVINTIDDTSPPLDFQFVTQSVLRNGVEIVDEDFMIGCKCRKDNGRQMGCEYLQCECLDDSVNSEGKKAFPYSQAKFNTACLRDAFIKGRNHIYECNKRCNCGSNCKNRVVQHGRKVGLEIFKTINRGWGLRCTQDLKRGQFIDTYRGEIITHDDANRRGETRTPDQGIYLMSLDKWADDDGARYVCDGMHLGGPTRFVNHSCDPNCAVYTVSYNHADIHVYDLAFFATERISAGTELTFNYVDDDEVGVITEERADEMERENGYRPAKCLCGSVRCRGYFFT